MNDSNPVDDTDLDAFSAEMFSAKPVEQAVEEVSEEITPEQTPSATEEESNPEAEVLEDDDGEDTPEIDDDSETPEAEKPKGKKKKPAKERIDELTRDKYDLQRRLDALERVIAERDSKEPVKETVHQDAPVEIKAPQPDDLDDDGNPLYPLGEFDTRFVTDLTRFVAKQERDEALAEQVKKTNQQMIEEAQKELTMKWQNDVIEAQERLPNFVQNVSNLETTFASLPSDYGNFLASSIMALDNGPDVLNYFAENLEEAKRVVAQGPFQATIALGRLDAKFATEKDKAVEREPVAPTTQAPPPPPKNKGSTVAKSIRPDTENLDDFEKLFFK